MMNDKFFNLEARHLLFTLIYFVCFSCNISNGLCENDNIETISNSDKNYKVVKYERDCGATTNTSLHLAILDYKKSLTDLTN
ncbi:MAG TPA: hypothetical protein VGO09_01800, partial [Flavisolibacter sp.]|nr:hypothetical protein [Flavisolibacter sp.]